MLQRIGYVNTGCIRVISVPLFNVLAMVTAGGCYAVGERS